MIAPSEDFALALYTVHEAAEVLRCHFDKVYGLVRTGEIKGTRIGRSIRISREELERFIRDGSATSGEEPEKLADPVRRAARRRRTAKAS